MRKTCLIKKEIREKTFQKMIASQCEKSKPNVFYTQNLPPTNFLRKSSVYKFGQSFQRNIKTGISLMNHTQEDNDEESSSSILLKHQSLTQIPIQNSVEPDIPILTKFYNKSRTFHV